MFTIGKEVILFSVTSEFFLEYLIKFRSARKKIKKTVFKKEIKDKNSKMGLQKSPGTTPGLHSQREVIRKGPSPPYRATSPLPSFAVAFSR
jgi:hypothetical protein